MHISVTNHMGLTLDVVRQSYLQTEETGFFMMAKKYSGANDSWWTVTAKIYDWGY